MAQVKLAEALLRRKELQQKVDVLKNIKENKMYYEVRGQRVKITEGLEDINANYPKLDVSQVTKEYDWHARQLRLVDAAIQQANWTTELTVEDSVMKDFDGK